LTPKAQEDDHYLAHLHYQGLVSTWRASAYLVRMYRMRLMKTENDWGNQLTQVSWKWLLIQRVIVWVNCTRSRTSLYGCCFWAVSMHYRNWCLLLGFGLLFIVYFRSWKFYSWIFCLFLCNTLSTLSIASYLISHRWTALHFSPHVAYCVSNVIEDEYMTSVCVY